jgi:hypothetical protein
MMTVNLKERDELILTELTQEFGISDIAMKIIVNQFLDLRLFPQPNNRYYTEKGIKALLLRTFNETNSLVLSDISTKPPFDAIDRETIQSLLSEIEIVHLISQELYIQKEYYNELVDSFQTNGVIYLAQIATEIKQPFDIVKQEILRVLVPSDDGWLNNRKEYLTTKYISDQSREMIVQNHILSLSIFLEHIGKPEIDFPTLKQITNSHSQGRWLEDIHVFLTLDEFKEIEENAIRIDEERVAHLLKPINLNFAQFLDSLQKILEIQTFRSADGRLISLESLYPEIAREIQEKQYLGITDFCTNHNLDKSVKQLILDHLSSNYQGQVNTNNEYFFEDRFIAEIKNELQTQPRINYNVLGFKLNITPDLLQLIINEVLRIQGFHNNLGEFVTIPSVTKEYKELITHNVEFDLEVLLEILEIVDNQPAIDSIKEILRTDKDVRLSSDETKVFTLQRAIDILTRFVKNPITQSKEKIPVSAISMETKLTQSDITEILSTLEQNNLIPGKLKDTDYYP